MHELLKAVILPPASVLIIALIGQLFWARTKAGRWVVTASLVGLYLLSTPMIGDTLLATLEVFPPLPAEGPLPRDAQAPNAQAIVILGADSRMTPEYSAPSPGAMTLERLRYGAHLHRRTGLPILVTGGIPPGRPTSLGSVMRRSLVDDFGVPVAWVEDRSRDTHQNAVRSAEILKAEGITRILLVTHAWHMPRAKRAFENAGLTVICAPTAVIKGAISLDDPVGTVGVRDMLPSAKALQSSYFAFHEMLGLAFYRLAYHPAVQTREEGGRRRWVLSEPAG